MNVGAARAEERWWSQQAYRAPAARCPSWCTVTRQQHRAEQGEEGKPAEYSHEREVYLSPEADERGLPEARVRALWCPDNDWDPADPYGTDTPAVHALISMGSDDDQYTPTEARQMAARLERAAAALREAAGIVEAGVL